MRPSYKVFRGVFTSWEALFQQAADLATEVGPERLLSISHSESDAAEGVVTVWYWNEPGRGEHPGWQAYFQVFRGAWTTWEALFTDAARYADEVGRERLIGISHSEGKSDGVVTVWYWGAATPEKSEE